MDNTKDYNFFYVKEKETDNSLPLKVIVTAALGEGQYTTEEVGQYIEQINQKNTNGKVTIYQDDGQNFWEVSSTNTSKLDIGTEEDNFKKWDEIKSNTLSISPEDIIGFCESKDNKVSENSKKIKLK